MSHDSDFLHDDPFEAAEALSRRAMPRGPGDGAYLEGLNPAQREAVETLDGPVLVLAGAGTGKTRVLTTRLAHLIALGKARPNEILAVTFTNKAAREMKARIGALVGQAIEGMPWLGTFHSLAARILRRHAELVGLQSNFSILDADDQLRLLKQLIQAENIDEKRWPPRMLAAEIDRWKNRGWSPEHVPADEAAIFANGRGGKLYADYQARLKTLNAADFGDLLLHTLTILQGWPDVLAQYHRWFRYILVDEYQDTNVAQYLWLRLLAAGSRNLCCVGDDDQSIYGWRGAEVGNILRFEKDFPGAAVIRLEQNYRSTGSILACAASIISGNQQRLGKTLWTETEGGEPVRLMGLWDGDEEARWVGEEIESLQRGGRRDPISLNDMAVLVRASHQMRAFEDRFIAIALPYRVIGGPRFYERLEIRDAIAYLRLVIQPDDGLALERVINTPRRGVGDKALQTLNRIARERGLSLPAAAGVALDAGELKGKAKTSIAGFLGDLDRWRALYRDPNRQLDITEIAGMILDESGYTGMWLADKAPEAPGRLENLKELVQTLAEFDTLEGFLEHVSLVMDAAQDDAEEKVSIMTLHGAKGLEFRAVFLPGWEDGLFPSQRAMDEAGRKGLEEERRLAYVGVTRAEELLSISFAANRRVYNQWRSALPSRFIDELPSGQVEIRTPAGLYGGGPAFTAAKAVDEPRSRVALPTAEGTSALEARAAQSDAYSSPGWKRMQAAGGPRPSPPTARPKPGAGPEFAIGERVFSQKFGYGVIQDMDADKLLVLFDKAGEKRVMAGFVEPAEGDGGDTPF